MWSRYQIIKNGPKWINNFAHNDQQIDARLTVEIRKCGQEFALICPLYRWNGSQIWPRCKNPATKRATAHFWTPLEFQTRLIKRAQVLFECSWGVGLCPLRRTWAVWPQRFRLDRHTVKDKRLTLRNSWRAAHMWLETILNFSASPNVGKNPPTLRCSRASFIGRFTTRYPPPCWPLAA